MKNLVKAGRLKKMNDFLIELLTQILNNKRNARKQLEELLVKVRMNKMKEELKNGK